MQPSLMHRRIEMGPRPSAFSRTDGELQGLRLDSAGPKVRQLGLGTAPAHHQHFLVGLGSTLGLALTAGTAAKLVTF